MIRKWRFQTVEATILTLDRQYSSTNLLVLNFQYYEKCNSIIALYVAFERMRYDRI